MRNLIEEDLELLVGLAFSVALILIFTWAAIPCHKSKPSSPIKYVTDIQMGERLRPEGRLLLQVYLRTDANVNEASRLADDFVKRTKNLKPGEAFIIHCFAMNSDYNDTEKFTVSNFDLADRYLT